MFKYMQLETTIDIWMFKYKLPSEMKKKVIKQKVERKLKDKEDVYVENLLSQLPPHKRFST